MGNEDRIIIGGSGSGAIDPDYMALAKHTTTMHTAVEAHTTTTAAPLGIGAGGGGIMYLSIITAALGHYLCKQWMGMRNYDLQLRWTYLHLNR